MPYYGREKNNMKKICKNPNCKKEFEAERDRREYCSLKCSTERQAINMAKSSHKNNRMKNGQARKMGLKSREHENKVANKLKYKNIFKLLVGNKYKVIYE